MRNLRCQTCPPFNAGSFASLNGNIPRKLNGVQLNLEILLRTKEADLYSQAGLRLLEPPVEPRVVLVHQRAPRTIRSTHRDDATVNKDFDLVVPGKSEAVPHLPMHSLQLLACLGWKAIRGLALPVSQCPRYTIPLMLFHNLPYVWSSKYGQIVARPVDQLLALGVVPFGLGQGERHHVQDSVDLGLVGAGHETDQGMTIVVGDDRLQVLLLRLEEAAFVPQVSFDELHRRGRWCGQLLGLCLLRFLGLLGCLLFAGPAPLALGLDLLDRGRWIDGSFFGSGDDGLARPLDETRHLGVDGCRCGRMLHLDRLGLSGLTRTPATVGNQLLGQAPQLVQELVIGVDAGLLDV